MIADDVFQSNPETLDDAADRIEAQAAEIEKLRGVVDALLQHEASTFFGPEAEKHVRASWRGVIRKARAALGETK